MHFVNTKFGSRYGTKYIDFEHNHVAELLVEHKNQFESDEDKLFIVGLYCLI